jgi:CheY-like chemotaxis protein
MRILVIEDQPQELKLALHVLSAAGYRVEALSSADSALETIAVERPVLILLDMGLPGTDGLGLINLLKGDPQTCAIPIVAVTSLPEKYSKGEVLGAGADAYFVKPLSTRTLPETLSKIIGGSGQA